MGNGKQKIEIKKIENLQARNVCFSKRRRGFFKKASELSRLFPDARIAAVVFSPAGKPYVYGDPRLLSEPDQIIRQSTCGSLKPESDDHQLLSKIKSMLSLDLSGMSIDELERFLDELKAAKMEFGSMHS